MSTRATKYVNRLRRLPDGSRLTRTGKLILHTIAVYHNERTNDAWPSLALIASNALCSKQRVIDLLPVFEKSGVLAVDRSPRQAEDGNRASNRYTFPALPPISELRQKQGKKYPRAVPQPEINQPVIEGGGSQISDPQNMTTGGHVGSQISGLPLIEQDPHGAGSSSRESERSAIADSDTHCSGINSTQASQPNEVMEFSLTTEQITSLQALNPYKPVAASWSKFCFNCIARNVRRTEKAWLDWFSREFELLEPVKTASMGNCNPSAANSPVRSMVEKANPNCGCFEGFEYVGRELMPCGKCRPQARANAEAARSRPNVASATATPATT